LQVTFLCEFLVGIDYVVVELWGDRQMAEVIDDFPRVLPSYCSLAAIFDIAKSA